MKYIKKLKQRKIIEICLWVFFVGITYMLWDFEEFRTTAAYYSDSSVIEVIDDPTYSKILYALNDEKAKEFLTDYKLTLINNTYREERYNVYIGISKDINHEFIKIKTDEVEYLNKKYSYEDDDYRYYLLDTNMLQGNKKKYSFSLYNDINGENFQPYDLNIKLEKI